MTDVDAKAGLSSMCRQNDHPTCGRLKARCSCVCHGRHPQTPPAIKENVVALRNEPRVQTPPQPQRGGEGQPTAAPHSTQIVFCDPPHGGRGATYDWTPALQTVMTRPGTWARIRTWPGQTTASTAATHIRRRADLPAGTWEFKSARIPTGSGLWARYTRR